MGTPNLPDYRWIKSALKVKREDEDDDSIGHFRITFSLFLKASLGTHPFI